MRIHSDILTEKDFHEATKAHGMTGVFAEIKGTGGSRSRKRHFDVKLTGSTNPRGVNPGTSQSVDRWNLDRAATWDEWGMWIDALFTIDPDAIIGQYPDRDVFRDVTYCRYDSLTHPYQHHGAHRWVRDGSGVHACRDCEAQFNWGDLNSIRLSKKGN